MSPESTISFRRLPRSPDITDLEGMARVHKAAYSAEHLTSHFSVPMLVEYNAALVSASDLSVVAVAMKGAEVRDHRVVGLIISGQHVSAGVTNFLRSHRLRVLWVVLRRPRFLWERAVSWLHGSRSRPDASRASYRLLSIGVSPEFQSKGVGSQLLDFFEEQLAAIGVDVYGLSVRNSNHRAVAFYERRGFVVERRTRSAIYLLKHLSS